MGDVAHGIATCGHRQAQQALALGHVEQFVLDAVGAGTGVHDPADDDVVLLQRAPGGELDVTATDRLFDDLRFGQRTELARTFEVGTDHAGDVGLRSTGCTLVGHRHDGDREGGGIAADDVDIQPLLLRDGSERQQQGRKHGKPARHLLHGELKKGKPERGIAKRE
ncbi:hypothetical protein D3C73_1039210 [compost metagenome]